jgi:hypothetical protein
MESTCFVTVSSTADTLAAAITANLKATAVKTCQVEPAALGDLSLSLSSDKLTIDGQPVAGVLFRSFPDTSFSDGFMADDRSFCDAEIGATWLAALQLDSVSGVFVRLNPRPLQPPNLKLSPQNEHAFIVERRNGIQYLLDNLPMVVANRPSAGRSNGSKPYQMRSLMAFGFEVPKWLTSNEEVNIKEFAETCGQGVIYKACSGLRSRVRKLDDEVLQRMKNGSTPVVVQEYITGRDVRVHTVIDQVFPTEVVGGGVDYRFEHEHCLYRATVAPDEIADMCCRFAKRERLVIAGFDFRVTDDGQWFCLEMNPVPTFLPYEMSTTQPIGDALLDVMTA